MSSSDLAPARSPGLPPYLRGLTAVVVAVISQDGRLLEANEGFRGLPGVNECDARDLFVNPSFERLWQADGSGVSYQGILNLGTASDCCSLSGTTYRSGENLLLVGEHDVSELQGLATAVIDLNEDLAEAQRAILRANRELKAKEERLSLLNAELERRVEERTRELASRNAELEAFVYSVSHDLRQPLLALDGMCEILLDAAGSGALDEVPFAAQRIQANVGRMGELLSGLLRASRASHSSGKAEEVDLGSVTLTVLRDLEDDLARRGVQVDLPSRWLRVRYPPQELYQVVANLLGNAAKHAGGGRVPTIRVECHAEGSQARFTVSDDGPGIPIDQRARVFDLFRQLNPQAGGVGVGLAIVKRVVERNGGVVEISDSPLGGAAVSVTFPLASRS